MKLAYIAGRYTAPTRMGTEFHVALANLAGRLVAEAGFYPVVPHALGHGIDPDSSKFGPQFWYELTAEVLRRCDVCVMLPKWQDSTGARSERDIARDLGMEVYDLADLVTVPEVMWR